MCNDGKEIFPFLVLTFEREKGSGVGVGDDFTFRLIKEGTSDVIWS